VSFVEAVFTLLSVTGLLYMRRTHPHLSRPIKVNICLPIIFFIICTFLVILPFFEKPFEVGVGLAFIITGIPVYFVTIYWKNKPMWLMHASNSFNLACAKFFLCVPEETKDQ